MFKLDLYVLSCPRYFLDNYFALKHLAPSEVSAELICTCTGIGINPSIIDNLFNLLFIWSFLLDLKGKTNLLFGFLNEFNCFFVN